MNKTKDTQEFLKALQEDLKPSKKITSKKVIGILFLFFIAYMAFLNLTSLHFRYDFNDKFKSLSFLFLILTPFIIMTFFILKISHFVSFGPVKTVGNKKLIYFSCLLLFLSVATYAISHLGGASLALSRQDLVCTLGILKIAIPVWFLLPLIEIYTPRTEKFYSWVKIMGFSVGLSLINLHCPYDAHGHHLFGHFLFPMFITLIGSAFFIALSNKLVSKIFKNKKNKF